MNFTVARCLTGIDSIVFQFLSNDYCILFQKVHLKSSHAYNTLHQFSTEPVLGRGQEVASSLVVSLHTCQCRGSSGKSCSEGRGLNGIRLCCHILNHPPNPRDLTQFSLNLQLLNSRCRSEETHWGQIVITQFKRAQASLPQVVLPCFLASWYAVVAILAQLQLSTLGSFGLGCQAVLSGNKHL